ncbi:MAG: AAA family ATPase [Bacteroidia bacterium]|nr:AAA family ATPase [Bacteroidia bacterium]
MKIHVQNLGAIRKAEIELKPFTLFVGKNNTYKTYMAHVAGKN